MEIRIMRKEEAKSASDIVEKNYSKEDGVKSLKEIQEMFGENAIKPCYYVAEENNKVLGFAGFIQSWMDYDTYELCWVNVDPEYQRKGIGKKLVARLLEEIKKRENAKLILLSSNSPSFYENHFNFHTLHTFGEDPEHLMMLAI